jgi:hypothetical protein
MQPILTGPQVGIGSSQQSPGEVVPESKMASEERKGREVSSSNREGKECFS